MKRKCDILSPLGHNGLAVRPYKGHKKSDPEFNACVGCAAYLRISGALFKEVRVPAKPAKKSSHYLVVRERFSCISYLSVAIVSDIDVETLKRKAERVRLFWEPNEASAFKVPAAMAEMLLKFYEKKLKKSKIWLQPV